MIRNHKAKIAMIFGLISMWMDTAFAGTAASITGRWVTQDRDAIVDITPCGNAICGRIVTFLKMPADGLDQRDKSNKDPKLRSRRILGMTVLQNLTKNGMEWRGTIYDPNSGKNYRSVVYLTKNGTLIVKGCYGPFCKKQRWTAES